MSRIIRPLSRALALTSLLLALPAFAGEKRTVVNPYGTPERITTWKLPRSFRLRSRRGASLARRSSRG